MRRPHVSMQGTASPLSSVPNIITYLLSRLENWKIGELKNLCVKRDEKSVYDKWKEGKGNESLGGTRKVGRGN
jgi:hypothetical protein